MEYPLKEGVPEYVGGILKALESQRDLNDAWTRLFEAYQDEIAKLWQDNAELRDELHALANRVETLTRARLTEPAETCGADGGREADVKTVDRGAAFLDEVAPGWDEKIDPDTLDLGSTCNCVLGQLYHAEHPRRRDRDLGFGRKMRELDLTYAAARRLGFIAWGNARYGNVTAAWARLIRSRREAKS